jgi:hypothetical protein
MPPISERSFAIPFETQARSGTGLAHGMKLATFRRHFIRWRSGAQDSLTSAGGPARRALAGSTR